MPFDPQLWRGRRVLLTGHTGFKGSWTALLLQRAGAQVTGLALAPSTEPSLHQVLSPWPGLESILHDIRDRDGVFDVVRRARPEIVIHMAAQALVRDSYRDPLATVSTNVMGTANLLEALRELPGLMAVLVVTSDKVYDNPGREVSLAEHAALGGHDPYSASKAAVEIITRGFARSFYAARGVPLCTARAGNVIGGGDWSRDRIAPDLWRAYDSGVPVELRYPDAVRPWQHVLDPVYGYLRLVEHMIASPKSAPAAMNFGPPPKPVRTVLQLAERFARTLGSENLWTIGRPEPHLQEDRFLFIDARLASETLGWRTALDVDTAIAWTAEWYKAFSERAEMRRVCSDQIEAYFARVRQQAEAPTSATGAAC